MRSQAELGNEITAAAVRMAAVIPTDETRVMLLLPPEIPPAGDEERSQRIHEVLSKAQAENKTHVSARMWVYRSLGQCGANVFDFTVSRHRDGPAEFLKHFTGTLLGDCYSGFESLVLAKGSRVVRAACHAHARRYVYEAREYHPREAAQLLAWYRQLYDVEDQARGKSPEDVLALRQQHSVPVMNQLRAWLDGDAARSVLPKSRLGEAVRYLNNQWEPLCVFLGDGPSPPPRGRSPLPRRRQSHPPCPPPPPRIPPLKKLNLAVVGAYVQPKHIVFPLLLRRTVVRQAQVRSVDTAAKVVTARHCHACGTFEIPYDHLVLALGSVPNFFGLAGVQENALTMKSLADATALHAHVIDKLEHADLEPDPVARRALLTFVVAGGGFAGVETLAELNDFVRGSGRYYSRIDPAEVRMVLIHSGERILPEVSSSLSERPAPPAASFDLAAAAAIR